MNLPEPLRVHTYLPDSRYPCEHGRSLYMELDSGQLTLKMYLSQIANVFLSNSQQTPYLLCEHGRSLCMELDNKHLRKVFCITTTISLVSPLSVITRMSTFIRSNIFNFLVSLVVIFLFIVVISASIWNYYRRLAWCCHRLRLMAICLSRTYPAISLLSTLYLYIFLQFCGNICFYICSLCTSFMAHTPSYLS